MISHISALCSCPNNLGVCECVIDNYYNVVIDL